MLLSGNSCLLIFVQLVRKKTGRQVESAMTQMTSKFDRQTAETEEAMKKIKTVLEKSEKEKSDVINMLEEEKRFLFAVGICFFLKIAAQEFFARVILDSLLEELWKVACF